jgi:hypothetical protein
MSKRLLVTVAALLLIPLAGCATSQDPPTGGRPGDPTGAPTTTASPPQTTGGAQMSATRVRFSTRDAEIIIRVVDNPTSRDLLSKLPLTLTFEEFAGREKISYLPKRLTTDGPTGHAARNGDLIYYVPWGNLGLFYNAAGGGPDDDVIAIGTVESGMEHIDRLEQGSVIVETIE